MHLHKQLLLNVGLPPPHLTPLVLRPPTACPRRHTVRASVAESQRSQMPHTLLPPTLEQGTTTVAPASDQQHALPQQRQHQTPFSSPASPASPPASPFPTQPTLSANGRTHGAPMATHGSTMQRLRMVASSLESVEDDDSEPTSLSQFSPSPSPPQEPSPPSAAASSHVSTQAEGSEGSEYQGNGTQAALPAVGSVSVFRTPEEVDAAKKLAAEEDLLIEEIKSCESWRDLLEILEDEIRPGGSGVTLFVSVKAISRMASIGQGLPPSEKAQLLAEAGFQALAKQLIAGVPKMKPIQLANSLDAFANLGVIPHNEGLKAYLERSKVCAERMNGRDLATLLHAFAVMRVRPGRRTLDALGFRAVHVLQESGMQSQSLSMLVHACGMLEYKNRVLLAAAADTAVRTMPNLAPQAVANLAWAFAKLDFYSYAFQRSALQAFAANPSAYKPQEVCNLLWASTRQRFHPEEVLAIMVRSLAEHAQQLRGPDFASVFLALGTFGVHPGQKMLNQLLSAAEMKLTSLQPVELCNIYWGLGLMGEGLHPSAIHIASLLPDHYEANRLNPGLLRQVFTAYLGGKLTLANTGDGTDSKLAAAAASISFPTPMMDAMKRAWMASTMTNSMAPEAVKAAAGAASSSEGASRTGSGLGASSSKDESTSSSGRAMRKPAMPAAASTITKRALPRIMQALGVRHGIGRPTSDGLVSIDIALRPGPDRFLALQVVEEHEHTANTGKFLGPQRFQSSVLEANGWEVKHVMAKDLRMLDEAAWPAFIAELLCNMGVRVAPNALAAAQAALAIGSKEASKKTIGVGGRYRNNRRSSRTSSSSSSSGNQGLDMLMDTGSPRDRAPSRRRGGQQQRGSRR